jgi:hypothetical protein
MTSSQTPPHHDSATEPAWVETEDLAQIPVAYRRLIAHWLVQRGDVRPRGLVSPERVHGHNDALRGAAVDLMFPLADDSTVAHAAEVLTDLADDSLGVDAAGDPTGILRFGSRHYADMTYYTAALNAISELRAALASEQAIARTTTAASSQVDGDIEGKPAPASAGDGECLTHDSWKTSVDRAADSPDKPKHA